MLCSSIYAVGVVQNTGRWLVECASTERLPVLGSKIQGVDAGQGDHGRDAVSSCVTLEAQLVFILFTC